MTFSFYTWSAPTFILFSLWILSLWASSFQALIQVLISPSRLGLLDWHSCTGLYSRMQTFSYKNIEKRPWLPSVTPVISRIWHYSVLVAHCMYHYCVYIIIILRHFILSTLLCNCVVFIQKRFLEHKISMIQSCLVSSLKKKCRTCWEK